MKQRQWLLAVFVIFAMLFNACAAPAAPAAPAAEGGAAAGGAAAPAGGTTFVDTPRNETLILDNLNGSLERPEYFNPYTPGVEMGRGYHEICLDNLWEINTVTGEQYPALAAEMPKALNEDFTSFEIKLRPGIFWDDGTEFTADDVVFTLQLPLNNDKLPAHGWSVDYSRM